MHCMHLVGRQCNPCSSNCSGVDSNLKVGRTSTPLNCASCTPVSCLKKGIHRVSRPSYPFNESEHTSNTSYLDIIDTNPVGPGPVRIKVDASVVTKLGFHVRPIVIVEMLGAATFPCGVHVNGWILLACNEICCNRWGNPRRLESNRGRISKHEEQGPWMEYRVVLWKYLAHNWE